VRNVIPYGRQEITEADISAVVATLKSDYLTQGPAVERFEDTLGNYLGADHVVAVSNGTAGLHIAYLAAGVTSGDAVIVPAITFAATANAALYCGATPVFADVDIASGNLSIESVKRCIQLAKDAGLRPKILAPVHYAGRPCNMPELCDIASKHGMLVVEDACHALGAEYREGSNGPFQKVGSAAWTSMTVFSFHPVKHITTGEGGAVTTQNPLLAQRLRLLRSHGITKNSTEYENKERAWEDDQLNPWYHEMQSLGLNYRICDIQAALGESQLSRIVSMIKRRRLIASMYDNAFGNQKTLQPAASDTSYGLHSYHLYPVLIDYRTFNTTRAKFMSALREQGIGTQVHYIPVPWHPYYEGNRHLWLADDLHNAAIFYERELSLPMFSTLTDDDISKVINGVLSLLH
jgi:UDP-4-amino-4,6-dideoxy-N-acetyl-beta-L-altrosamine transaminase